MTDFDDLADLYDALIDWPRRLVNEEPFYRAIFERVGAGRVLDAACGAGRHAAMFHSWGCQVEGADISPGMIERCRREFGESESLRWVVRAFDQPPADRQRFDAVICVGNSLALAPDLAAVRQAVEQMLAALRRGGVCVIQVVNLWHLPDGPTVWQKCKRVRVCGRDHILIKGTHRSGDRGYVDFIDLLIDSETVEPRFDSPVFLGLEAEDLARVAREAGARRVRCYGDYQLAPYQRAASQDLILVAEV